MNRLSAHFDGKVFIPDEPVDLPVDQKVVLLVDAAGNASVLPPTMSGKELVELVAKINWPVEDLREMAAAIEDCERIDPNEW